MVMRRDQRQTGNTRIAKPSKLDAVHPSIAANVRPGPFPWDRYQPGTRKPSNRALRRSFGANVGSGTRKS